jgi:hypothetical protein
MQCMLPYLQAKAMQKAFADCANLPAGKSCDAIAEASATAVAQAVVEAVTKVTGSVSGDRKSTAVTFLISPNPGTAPRHAA